MNCPSGLPRPLQLFDVTLHLVMVHCCTSCLVCLSGQFKDPVERISAHFQSSNLHSIFVLCIWSENFLLFSWHLNGGKKGRLAETKCEGSAAPLWPKAVRFIAGLYRKMYVGCRVKRLCNMVGWFMMRSNDVTKM